MAQSFSTHGLDENGKLKWTLEGESADFKGSIMDLKEATAHIINLRKCNAMVFASNGQKFTLKSPHCQVMLALRELKSDSALEFTADGITGSGIGYDINLDQKIIRLRTTVRFTIKQNTGKNFILPVVNSKHDTSEQSATKANKSAE